MTANANGFYKVFLKGFNKAVGSKPVDEAFTQVHALGARPGKQALALAMMLRPEGATNAQIVMAAGAPQLNKMRDLVARKLVKRDMNVAPSEAGHTVYKIELTAKGADKVTQAAKAETEAPKAAKAKRVSKPKAVTPEVVTEATPEAGQPQLA